MLAEAQRPHHQKILLVAYLAHLAVPLYLLLDELVSYLLGDFEIHLFSIDSIVCAVAVVWLAIALGLLFLSHDRAALLEMVIGPLIGIYTVYVCLFLLEIFARTALVAATMPTLRWPGTKLVYSIDPSQYPGVNGTKTFTVNEIGLRGPSLPQQRKTYKIVAIGGSTTECMALDDSEEWPHLLMEKMNAKQNGYPVWVANAGVDGHNTVDHLVLLQTLPFLKDMNLLIFSIGINDMHASLAFEGAPTQCHLEQSVRPLREYVLAGAYYRYPLYKRLQLVRIAKKAAASLNQKLKPEGERIKQAWFDLSSLRSRRASAQIVPVPDLHVGLEEYRDRVLKLADACRALDIRCLFVTQPSLWRSDLTPAEQRLLWLGPVRGWERPKGYASAADLGRALDAYNRVLLTTCRQSRLECYDLASVVPKDTSAFYDDCHFNEGGARIVANRLTDYLLSRPPFSEEARKP